MKHYEVVCGVIKKDDKILICQRGPGRALEGKFEFPGGKVELNESHEETIMREIKEELKCNIEVEKYLCESYYEYNSQDTYPFEPFSIRLYAYLCTLTSEDMVLTEHTKSLFVSKEELSNYDFAKADIEIIDQLKKIL